MFFVGLCNNLSLMWEVELSHNSTIPSCCSLSNSRKTSLFPFKAIPNGLEKTCPTEVTSAFSQVIFDFFFKFLLLMPGAKPPTLTGDQISFTHIPAKTVAIRCLYCPFDAHFTSLLLVTYHLVTQPQLQPHQRGLRGPVSKYLLLPDQYRRAHSRAFAWSGLVNLWKSLLLHLIHKEKKKVLFFKIPEYENVRMMKLGSSISSLHLEEQTVPILPVTASAAMVLSYHHGSKINVIYSEIFNEKREALGEMWRCRFTFQMLMVGRCHPRIYYKTSFNKIFWKAFVLVLCTAKVVLQSHK